MKAAVDLSTTDVVHPVQAVGAAGVMNHNLVIDLEDLRTITVLPVAVVATGGMSRSQEIVLEDLPTMIVLPVAVEDVAEVHRMAEVETLVVLQEARRDVVHRAKEAGQHPAVVLPADQEEHVAVPAIVTRVPAGAVHQTRAAVAEEVLLLPAEAVPEAVAVNDIIKHQKIESQGSIF